MADYIYLLENRLVPAQRAALRLVRELARQKGLTVFLVGGAVRDLTSGSPVRDLDVVVQGNARQLKKDLERLGAVLTGEQEAAQALHLRFPGGVRMELGSTMTVTFPKPGKPVMKPSSILDDLRRRDFTVNAMALSLNEGSYGLLMDPLNGVADIENRQLRLVSNYGFIEDPVRMIRAARLMARLGWTLDEKTQTRYETGKQEDYISVLSDFHRGYETEEIFHEEDPLRVMKRLEAEGWMKFLAPYWTSAKVNLNEFERLRDVQTQLQVQEIFPDIAAASFPLLTARLTPKEVASMKASFPRQGFVQEIEALEAEAKEFAGQLGSKAAALPSDAWKMLTSARPEVVLATAFSSKSPAMQAKFKSFHTEWPQARQKMPYAMMQEMRIVPELPGYDDLLEKLFFQIMDGNLGTPEEMKAFLEPFSPPAPPPPVSMRRARAAKKEAKAPKSRSKKVKAEAEVIEEEAGIPVDLPEVSGDGDEAELSEEKDQDDSEEPEPAPSKPVKVAVAKPKPANKPVVVKAAPEKAALAKPKETVAKAAVKSKAAPAPAKAVEKKADPVKAAVKSPAKTVASSKVAKAAPVTPAKNHVAPSAKKTAAKVAVKPVVKKAAAKQVPVKKIVKKVVAVKKAPVKGKGKPVKAPAKRR